MITRNFEPAVFSFRDPPCPCRKSTVDFTVVPDDGAGYERLEWHCKDCEIKTSITLL